MKNQEITVFYKWTAKPGKLDELEAIYQEVYKAMKEGKTHYSFSGEPDFKETISLYYSKYGVNVDPKTQVHITSGGSQAIFEAFGTILNPGDELIVQDPAYTGYVEPARYFGAKVVRANQKKVKAHIIELDKYNLPFQRELIYYPGAGA